MQITDDCERELSKAQKALSESCRKRLPDRLPDGDCKEQAADMMLHGTLFTWQVPMASSEMGSKQPVFWAGFSEEDTSGMASRKDLGDFVKSVNGILLHGHHPIPMTEWGQVAEAQS